MQDLREAFGFRRGENRTLGSDGGYLMNELESVVSISREADLLLNGQSTSRERKVVMRQIDIEWKEKDRTLCQLPLSLCPRS